MITMNTFHAFPRSVTNHILSNIPINNEYSNNYNVFITRGPALQNSRNLDNQLEIDKYFNSYNNFKVINPENSTFNNFVNFIRFANVIIITWGSALVNMVYLKPNTNVIILKSKSYEHENIKLFNKIIDSLNLKIFIVSHTNNNVKISDITNILRTLT